MFYKFCNSSQIVKNGKPNKIKCFKCKKCNKTFVNQDNHIEYNEKPSQIAVILRTEGNEFCSIDRILSKTQIKVI